MSHLFYREVRGSMTQFVSITPEQVELYSEGSLTYGQLADYLKRYGLSIAHVLYDPSRSFQSTFYADYDKALYRSIYLDRDYLSGAGLVDFEDFGKMAAEGNPYLKAKDWEAMYFRTIPLPMTIYDFQRRARDIEPEKVFEVWHGIHKRIDYSNGMWPAETLEYVFDNAPDIEKPEAGEDGLVTLYRGMGELSSPPETAISWSTHPGNALWFANHSGRGTHFVIAEAAPGDIVAYSPGFSRENEVIVRPGAVRNIRCEDMFPADRETFFKLTVSSLLEYQCVGRQAKNFGYEAEASPYQVHGLKHILRVLLLSLIYVHCSGELFTPGDRDILLYFALLHDVGRTSEEADDDHGLASVEMIQSKGLRVRAVELTAKEYRIAHLMIQYHSRDDEDGVAAIRSYPGFSRKDKDRSEWLYKICKDMDGLDRVRFNGLDYRFLRTAFARRLPLIAGCLLNEDMIYALGEQESSKIKERRDSH